MGVAESGILPLIIYKGLGLLGLMIDKIDGLITPSTAVLDV